jgi:hypothetical protein
VKSVGGIRRKAAALGKFGIFPTTAGMVWGNWGGTLHAEAARRTVLAWEIKAGIPDWS